MSRIQPLSTGNAGMTRLRTKGNAGAATLYDLLNGYITLAGTIKPRPGSVVDTTLPADTKGLTAHKCKLYVFSSTPVVMTDPDYVNAVVRHPSDPTVLLLQIHFASPFMGFLYVAAEFEDGQIWHYWLEELDPWSSGTAYLIGDRVFPSTENGFAYEATRPGSAGPAWAASVPRAVNDVIEPTVYNGYEYTVVSVTGDNPASGELEPDWPAEAGAQVIEFSAGNEEGTIDTSIVYPNYPLYDPYGGTIGGTGSTGGYRQYATVEP